MASILIIGRSWNHSNHLKTTLKRHNHTVTKSLYYRGVLSRVNAQEKFDIIIIDQLDECPEDYDQFAHNIRTLLAPSLLIISAKHASSNLASMIDAIAINFIELQYKLETWDELTILAEIAKHPIT